MYRAEYVSVSFCYLVIVVLPLCYKVIMYVTRVPNPGDAARATSCPTARAGSAIPDEVTGHRSTAVDHSPATPAFIPTAR